MRIGLNPYGIACTLGLRGRAAPRAQPQAARLSSYLDLAAECGVQGVELPTGMLASLPEKELDALRGRLAARGWFAVLSQGSPVDGIEDSIRCAKRLGASVLRVTLTGVLCGDRAEWGPRWNQTVAAASRALKEAAGRAATHGLALAVENHQDCTSAELVAITEAAGENVGVCLDTANALAVGEAPLAFARTVAARLRHVHLKDYRVWKTDEGFRLVRCALGEGVVPLERIAELAKRSAPGGTPPDVVIEIGALEARHVRWRTPAWWNGYPTGHKRFLDGCLEALEEGWENEHEDWRTPWERGAAPEEVSRYELDQLRRGAAYLKSLGLF